MSIKTPVSNIKAYANLVHSLSSAIADPHYLLTNPQKCKSRNETFRQNINPSHFFFLLCFILLLKLCHLCHTLLHSSNFISIAQKDTIFQHHFDVYLILQITLFFSPQRQAATDFWTCQKMMLHHCQWYSILHV